MKAGYIGDVFWNSPFISLLFRFQQARYIRKFKPYYQKTRSDFFIESSKLEYIKSYKLDSPFCNIKESGELYTLLYEGNLIELRNSMKPVLDSISSRDLDLSIGDLYEFSMAIDLEIHHTYFTTAETIIRTVKTELDRMPLNQDPKKLTFVNTLRNELSLDLIYIKFNSDFNLESFESSIAQYLNYTNEVKSAYLKAKAHYYLSKVYLLTHQFRKAYISIKQSLNTIFLKGIKNVFLLDQVYIQFYRIRAHVSIDLVYPLLVEMNYRKYSANRPKDLKLLIGSLMKTRPNFKSASKTLDFYRDLKRFKSYSLTDKYKAYGELLEYSFFSRSLKKIPDYDDSLSRSFEIMRGIYDEDSPEFLLFYDLLLSDYFGKGDHLNFKATLDLYGEVLGKRADPRVEDCRVCLLAFYSTIEAVLLKDRKEVARRYDRLRDLDRRLLGSGFGSFGLNSELVYTAQQVLWAKKFRSVYWKFI